MKRQVSLFKVLVVIVLCVFSLVSQQWASEVVYSINEDKRPSAGIYSARRVGWHNTPEFDPKDRIFFGYAILNNDLQNAEWGYFLLAPTAHATPKQIIPIMKGQSIRS